MFKFVESLNSAPPVLGAELWNVLLQDVKTTSGLQLEQLQEEKAPAFLKVVGAQQPQELVTFVLANKAYPFPLLFQKTQDLVQSSGADLRQCLTLGLKDLSLVWFPKLRIWQTKHPKASWDQKSILQLYTQDRPINMEAKAARIEERVLAEMERRDLLYSKKLEHYQQHGLPWIELCMRRMAVSNPRFTDEESLNVITFLSCIACQENNDFVDFKHLDELIKDLPVNIKRLQELLLLSKFTLRKNTPFLLWKLHETMPTRLPPRGAAVPPPKRQLEQEDEPQEVVEEEEDPQKVNEEEVEEQGGEGAQVERGGTRFYPGNKKVRWKPEEMNLVNLDDKLTHQQAYQQYLKKAEARFLPARTFIAFRFMRNRMAHTTCK